MARNPVSLSLYGKTSKFQSSLSLRLLLFLRDVLRNFLTMCYSSYGRKVWFRVIRNDCKRSVKFHTKKTFFENSTGELNAIDINKFEINLFFNRGIFLCLSIRGSRLFAREIFFTNVNVHRISSRGAFVTKTIHPLLSQYYSINRGWGKVRRGVFEWMRLF